MPLLKLKVASISWEEMYVALLQSTAELHAEIAMMDILRELGGSTARSGKPRGLGERLMHKVSQMPILLFEVGRAS